jgi:hypothetical protein
MGLFFVGVFSLLFDSLYQAKRKKLYEKCEGIDFFD